MAYMLPMKLKCDHPYCDNRATQEVFDYRNENKGQFCRRHAQMRVDDLNETQGQFGGKVR